MCRQVDHLIAGLPHFYNFKFSFLFCLLKPHNTNRVSWFCSPLSCCEKEMHVLLYWENIPHYFDTDSEFLRAKWSTENQAMEGGTPLLPGWIQMWQREVLEPKNKATKTIATIVASFESNFNWSKWNHQQLGSCSSTGLLLLLCIVCCCCGMFKRKGFWEKDTRQICYFTAVDVLPGMQKQDTMPCCFRKTQFLHSMTSVPAVCL